MINNKVLQLLLFSITSTLFVVAQDETLIEGNYNDPSLVTQTAFVEELLYVAGYVPEKIEVYQSLPNYSHVFRVKLDSVTGGFVFVRWDKQKKQHYVANKMIDPGVYYNLKSAQEIMRKQTQNASFSIEDGALQASDQQKIGDEDLDELRQQYDKREKEKQDAINAVEQKKIGKKSKEKLRENQQKKID